MKNSTHALLILCAIVLALTGLMLIVPTRMCAGSPSAVAVITGAACVVLGVALAIPAQAGAAIAVLEPLLPTDKRDPPCR